LGWLRAEKDVDPDDWYFKAHFFSDPVQPGSLGVQAMASLLQWYLAPHGGPAASTGPGTR
jgi:3-hydroxymyristoyl/3-hydroxydecanoyl-(acyl carrier protein) dehydratase